MDGSTYDDDCAHWESHVAEDMAIEDSTFPSSCSERAGGRPGEDTCPFPCESVAGRERESTKELGFGFGNDSS